jgi:molybdopterin biosynthesis enzyme MoaB
MSLITCAVITLSDKGSQGHRHDLSGELLKKLAMENLSCNILFYEVIPDEKS